MLLRALPNIITLIRILLTLPVAVSILRHEFGWTLGLFALASLSDGLDGFLARRFGWMSRFGAMLDPIADKLMLVVTFLLLTYTGYIPLWLAVVVISRDLIILSGATLYHVLYGAYEFAPTWLGKLSTALQFTLILLVLGHQSILVMPEWLIDSIEWAVFVVSSISGLDYVWVWSLKARAAHRRLQEK